MNVVYDIQDLVCRERKRREGLEWWCLFLCDNVIYTLKVPQKNDQITSTDRTLIITNSMILNTVRPILNNQITYYDHTLYDMVTQQ